MIPHLVISLLLLPLPSSFCRRCPIIKSCVHGPGGGNGKEEIEKVLECPCAEKRHEKIRPRKQKRNKNVGLVPRNVVHTERRAQPRSGGAELEEQRCCSANIRCRWVVVARRDTHSDRLLAASPPTPPIQKSHAISSSSSFVSHASIGMQPISLSRAANSEEDISGPRRRQPTRFPYKVPPKMPRGKYPSCRSSSQTGDDEEEEDPN